MKSVDTESVVGVEDTKDNVVGHMTSEGIET
jgi:hypothetical protein